MLIPPRHLLPALLVWLCCAMPTFAAEIFAKAEALSGSVRVFGAGEAERELREGMSVQVGQTIVTGADGEVHLLTQDSGLIALRPDSRFEVLAYKAQGGADDNIALSLLKGALRSVTGWVAKRNPKGYKIVTPTATIGIRGTDHETTLLEVDTEDDRAGVFETVHEGTTFLRTGKGEIDVEAGKDGYAPFDDAEPPRLLARRPGFLKRRLLRLEARIQQRKEALREIIVQRIQEVVENLRDGDLDVSSLSRAEREALKRRIELQRRLRDRRP